MWWDKEVDDPEETIEGKKGSKQEDPDFTMIKGTSCKKTLERLERSLIARLNKLISVKEVFLKLEKARVSAQFVNSIGQYKFLITLSSKKEVDVALAPGPRKLDLVFDEVTAWSLDREC